MNYKSYQQVLDLSCDKKRTTHKLKPKTETTAAPKRRTKTGCMTCRRRKKKCDEEKIDGKCQSCIRNFLDCCWPGEETTHECETTPVKAKLEVEEKKNTGASAYPSPVLSPKVEAHEPKSEVKILQLGGSHKVSKPKATKTKLLKKAVAQFVVTSFDSERMLCQIKS